MAKTYFTGLTDSSLEKDVVAKDSDMYIQFEEFRDAAPMDITTPAVATLTPAVSPVWDADEFNSTVALNLVVVDNNGKAAVVKIDDTIATAITFDSTAMVLEEDGTSSPDLTNGLTYQYAIYTPSNYNTYGPFFGYTEGQELNITDDMMKFRYDLPAKLKFQDLKERVTTITGGHVNIANADVIDTILGSVDYGLSTARFAKGIGSNPDTNRFYRVTLVNVDRTDRDYLVRTRRVQFALSGNFLGKSADEYKMATWEASLISDSFYPDTADLLNLIGGN